MLPNRSAAAWRNTLQAPGSPSLPIGILFRPPVSCQLFYI